MKQCPACKTTYTDETLSYCLADGKPLVPLADDQATIANYGGEATAVLGRGEQMRVEIPQEMREAAITPVYAPGAASVRRSSGGMKIILGVLALLLLIGVIVVVGGIVFYLNSKRPEVASMSNVTNRTPTATPSPSATANDKDDLREQIANLEKRLNEQKSANRPANIPLTLPNQPATTTAARVNSPSDGFLALRTFPNSEAGSRILQIPHGAVVTVGGCLNTIRVSGKTGRWCRASYNGYSGWVFDAFLVY